MFQNQYRNHSDNDGFDSDLQKQRENFNRVLPPLKSSQTLWSEAVVGTDPHLIASEKEMKFANIIFWIKMHPFPEKDFQKTTEEAFRKENAEWKMEMVITKMEEFDMYLLVDNVLVSKGEGRTPKAAKNDGYQDFVFRVLSSDFLAIRSSLNCHNKTITKLKLFESEDEVKELHSTAFRYDLLCKDHEIPQRAIPICSECLTRGHNKYFCTYRDQSKYVAKNSEVHVQAEKPNYSEEVVKVKKTLSNLEKGSSSISTIDESNYWSAIVERHSHKIEQYSNSTEQNGLKRGRGVKCPQGHDLQFRSPVNDGWACDAWCSDKRRDSGGCKRGITGFNQTTGVPHFICDVCDYYLCDTCYEHHKGIPGFSLIPTMNMKPLVDSKSKGGEIWDRIPIAITKKRKADYDSEEEAKVNKKKQEIKSKLHHYCKVCKIFCYGIPHYKEHLKGQKHKKKLAGGIAAEAVPQTISLGPNSVGKLCKLCDVCVRDSPNPGADAYAAHIRGAKQKKMKRLRELGKPIPPTDPVLVTAAKKSATTALNNNFSDASLTSANDNQEYKEVTPVMEGTPLKENWLIWNYSKSKQIEEPNDKQESKEELATPLISRKEKAELKKKNLVHPTTVISNFESKQIKEPLQMASDGSVGHTVFVYNIGPEATELDLHNLFGPFGPIDRVQVPRGKFRGNAKEKPWKGRGFGFVTFGDYNNACLSIQAMNGYPYEKNAGKPLQVSFKGQRRYPYEKNAGKPLQVSFKGQRTKEQEQEQKKDKGRRGSGRNWQCVNTVKNTIITRPYPLF